VIILAVTIESPVVESITKLTEAEASSITVSDVESILYANRAFNIVKSFD
jgi:hypothetical protein